MAEVRGKHRQQAVRNRADEAAARTGAAEPAEELPAAAGQPPARGAVPAGRTQEAAPLDGKPDTTTPDGKPETAPQDRKPDTTRQNGKPDAARHDTAIPPDTGAPPDTATPDAGSHDRATPDASPQNVATPDASPRRPATPAPDRHDDTDPGLPVVPADPGPPPAAAGLRQVPYVVGAVIIAANMLVLGSLRLPFLGPAVGFWFLVLYPIYLLFTTDAWAGSRAIERLGYSLAAVLLLLMLGGLAINTVLPPLGVKHPLDPIPVVILGDVLNIALYLVRGRRRAPFPWQAGLRALQPKAVRLLVLAWVCPLLAVLGANRLNNGAGDRVSMAALGCIMVALVLMLCWQRQLSDALLALTLYPLSLSLLLMTSLRGWYVTGHDIQSEYRVFQLTDAHGQWNISAFHTAYNACLSITILPTEIARVVNVDDPYVYRVFFQLLFAVCPVLAFAIARRYAPKVVSLLAVIYFVGFPTYYNDMPFINRQEIAFLFVCAAVLAITNSRWPQGLRRLAFLVAALGVELSHYSTMYLLLGTVAACWLAGAVIPLLGRLRRRGRAAADGPLITGRRTVGIGSVLAVAAMVALWGGLATRTAGPLVSDLASAVSQLGHANSATSYGVFSRNSLSPQQVLEQYRTAALKLNTGGAGSPYLPPATVTRYPTPLDNEPALPLTAFGRVLSRVGVPVATLNADVRQGAAKDEQLFIAAGFAAFLFSGRLRRRVSREVLYLCAGSIVMVGVFTVFPALTIDYGVLRAFQEALILTAPLLVVGSIAIFSPFGDKWSLRISGVVCLGIFASTVGLMPQLLGGYPAQLGLNDSGQYYDIYYVHPQDEAAVGWLAGKPGVLPDGLQAAFGPFTSNMFAFNSLSDVDGTQGVGDLYPLLLKRSSWVLLNYGIVHSGRAPLVSQGELLTYRYPRQLLHEHENLVYNNGGAEIYKY